MCDTLEAKNKEEQRQGLKISLRNWIHWGRFKIMNIHRLQFEYNAQNTHS